MNAAHPEPLPRFLPSHEDDEGEDEGRLPLRLVIAPALHALNSSFQERDDLRAKQGPMAIQLSPREARLRNLADGDDVIAFNALGEVWLALGVTEAVPDGIALVEGLHWLDGRRGVNALVSQRLTDEGLGSTFCDNRVDVRQGTTPATRNL